MSGASAPVLEMRGVSKRFQVGPNRVEALRSVDLRVERGEFVALVGPSGAGKTTLLEILGCLSLPSAGDYRFEGRSVVKLDEDELADLRGRSLGFVFQSFNLLPRLSALENVELPMIYQDVPARERRECAREALAWVGLAHREGHPAPLLSGGERQRVAIARAIATRPSVVLADEPTGNLDSSTGQEVLDLLCTVPTERRTLVVVTHDAGIAARAGRVLSVRDGRVSGSLEACA